MNYTIKSINKHSSMKKGSLYSKLAIGKKDISFLLLSLPCILWVFIFNYLPMAGIVIAFKNYRFDKGIIGSEWSGFKNFEFFFTSGKALKLTFTTVGYNFLFIVLLVVIPIIVSLMLYEVTAKKALKYFQTTMFFPHFLSWVIVAYMTYSILNPRLGILNSLLSGFGLKGLDWYSKPLYWYFIIPFANTWKHMGYYILYYFAALMSVDKELFEAAEIDGATKLQQKLHISIPSLIPLMVILTILALGRAMRADFGLFYQLSMDSPLLLDATDVLDTYLYRAIMQSSEFGISAAIGLFQSAVGFFMVMVTNTVVRKINPENALF